MQENRQTSPYAMVPDNSHTDIPGNPSAAMSSEVKLNHRSNGQPLRALSEDDWALWQHNGYIGFKQAVPREPVQATAEFLWEFEQNDPDDPQTWYTAPRADMAMKVLVGTGMVELNNHQHLWNDRQMPRVCEAFTDIWGTDKLLVTIDRANLNFPLRPGYEYHSFIHWDYDPGTKPQQLQGVPVVDRLVGTTC